MAPRKLEPTSVEVSFSAMMAGPLMRAPVLHVEAPIDGHRHDLADIGIIDLPHLARLWRRSGLGLAGALHLGRARGHRHRPGHRLDFHTGDDEAIEHFIELLESLAKLRPVGGLSSPSGNGTRISWPCPT